MRQQLLAAAQRNGGVIHRRTALDLVSEHVLKDAVRGGALVRSLPQVYVLAEQAADLWTRRRAALTYCPGAALSHLDALDIWTLLPAPTGRRPICLTTARHTRVRSHPGIAVHRCQSFALDRCVVRAGLRVVRLEEAVVLSWTQLPERDRRTPAICAVNERRTTGQRLAAELDRHRMTPGTAQMRALFRALELGVRSEFELWGHKHVFSDHRLPPSRSQVPVRLRGGRVVYLDRLFENELVIVEMDGFAFHGSREQRERDARRDAELASMGYLTIRVTHDRLVRDPEGFIRELLAVLARRRVQLGLRPA